MQHSKTCQNVYYDKPERENVDVLNQGGVGGDLIIFDGKKLFAIDKFDVGEVLAGHLVKSCKVMGGLFSPIIRLMLLLTGKVSSAIL